MYVCIKKYSVTCVTCPVSLESTVKKDVACCDVSCDVCDMLFCFF